MEGVTVVDHPLVQHKLTLIRGKNASTKSFRELLKEIGMLLCYEVTRDLPLMKVQIETPMARMMSPRIAGKKLVFAPILRAGMTFAEGMLDLVPAARVAHIGLYREPESFVDSRILFSKRRPISTRGSSHCGRASHRHSEYRGGRDRAAKGATGERDPLCLPAGGAARLAKAARSASRRTGLDGCDRRRRRRSGIYCSRLGRRRRSSLWHEMRLDISASASSLTRRQRKWHVCFWQKQTFRPLLDIIVGG